MKMRVSEWAVLPAIAGGLFLSSCGQKNDEDKIKVEIALPSTDVVALASAMPTVAMLPKGNVTVVAVMDVAGLWGDLIETPLGRQIYADSYTEVSDDEVTLDVNVDDVLSKENRSIIVKPSTPQSMVPVGDVVVALGDAWVQFMELNKDEWGKFGEGLIPLIKVSEKMQTIAQDPEQDPASALNELEVAVKPLMQSMLKMQWQGVQETVPAVTVLVQLQGEALPGTSKMLTEQLAEVAESSDGVLEAYQGEHNGLKLTGVKVNTVKVIEKLNEYAAATKDGANCAPFALDAEMLEAIAKLAKMPVYVLTTTVGDKLAIFVCGNPDVIRFAKNAEESVFADAAFAQSNWGAAGKPVALLGVSKTVNEQVMSLTRDIMKGFVKTAGDDVAMKATAEKGLAYLETCKVTCGSFGFASLSDKGLVAELVLDQTNVLDYGDWVIPSVDPLGKAFIAYSAKYNPVYMDYAKSSYRTGLVELLEQYVGRYVADEEAMAKISPVIKSAIIALVDGFGNQGGMAIDFDGALPAIPGAEEMSKLDSFPRLTVVQAVANRSLLGKAWDDAYNFATTEMPEEEKEQFTFKKIEKDDVASYVFPVPFNTKDFVANVTLTDKLWFVGTDINLVREAIKAPVSRQAGGFHFVLRTKPLCDFVGKATKAVPEMAKGVGSDGVESYMNATRQTLDSISIDATAKDGVEKIRLEVKKPAK